MCLSININKSVNISPSSIGKVFRGYILEHSQCSPQGDGTVTFFYYNGVFLEKNEKIERQQKSSSAYAVPVDTETLKSSSVSEHFERHSEILTAQRVGLGLSIPGGGAGAGLQHLTRELWARIQSLGWGGERLLYHCHWATSGKAQSLCTTPGP